MKEFYTWQTDSILHFVRYFFVAGFFYLMFYLLPGKNRLSLKIQKSFPAFKQIKHEIVYSVITLSIYSAASLMVFHWFRSELTKIYLDMSEYGVVYFLFSILILIILHDAWFYWTHRFLHIKWVYKRIHHTHHHSHNPTPWAAFSFHPAEAVISAGMIPIVVFLIPLHPFALVAFLTFMTLYSVVGHLGFEIYPLSFRKSKLGYWQNTSTAHNLHHKITKKNFGLYFTFWDRMMGTYEDQTPRT